MNGKHPIDELFARGLRDAEATPPAAMWEGIVRKRGSGHRFALLLRRYWGLSLALLLLLGTTTYALQQSAQDDGRGADRLAEVAGVPTTTASEAAVPEAGGKRTGPATLGSEQAADEPHTSPTKDPSGPTSNTAGVPSSSVPTAAKTASTPQPAPIRTASSNAPASTHAPADPSTNAAPGRTTSPEPKNFNTGAAPTSATGPATATRTTSEGTGDEPSPSRYRSEQELLEPATDHFATAMTGRPIGLERLTVSGEPQRNNNTAHYAPPKGTWWFGVFGAAYTEDRTWAGGDEELRRALERTETPHYPLGVGVSIGHSWPSGIHLSTGAEWLGSRYDFRHDDRVVTETTEIHNFIVTLDASVLVNISDTVTTTNETTVHQQAMNRFSTLRVPLELGWQNTWKRWHYGLRGGLAMEHLIQRGGYTLERVAPDVPDASGIRSVDAVSGKRTTTLLSGLVGLDLGYSLSERVVLGITPTYSKGLMRISSMPDPYTVPERIGIRVGLTYHIPHD